MKSSSAVLITAIVACAAVSIAYATRGVILTAPRTLERNAINKLHLSLFDVDAPGVIAISVVKTDSQDIIAETVVNVDSGENDKVIDLKIPETTDYTGRIWANGTFSTSDSYSFYEQDEVYFHSISYTIVFIQTDKPLYKPGQQVKFRVLPVDRNLRPFGKDTVGDVWVEDPSSSRIAQWKNVSFAQGIQQFDFPLSEEPPLGRWNIHVSVKEVIEVGSFEVKEYVLPKFEVTVTPPTYVQADAEIIPFKVCAKYTYGKNVQGILKINSSLESYSWSREKFPVLEIEERIDGCYNFDLNVSLVDEDFSYVYRRINILAEVTEDGTEVTKNGTAGVTRTHNPFTLAFLDDDYQRYFKPGIPYYRKMKANKPDGAPAPGEPIQVCATISRQRVLREWWATRKVKFCRNYTTAEDGTFTFQVPPQKTDAISLQLEAKSVKYVDDASAVPGRPKMYQPMTSTSVQPYFSPSKSYVQVQTAEETLPCGAQQNVKVLYTAQDGESYVFYYQVVSKGEVIKKGSKEVTFSLSDDVSALLCKDDLSVNDVRIPLVPSAKQQEGVESTEEDIDCSSGPIGTFEINLDVEAKLTPSFRLLVYYIKEDDETVADSAKFKVDKCFQNKVEFRFGVEEAQPGAKTTITLKASPNSMCGTKVVDKSVSLLDSKEQLTKEAIFQELQKFDHTQYYQRNHCNDKFTKGGKNKMASSFIYPPRPWSSSQYADALTAFEDAGFVALSDMKLMLRPCTSESSYDNYGGFAQASIGVRGGAAGRPPPSPAKPMAVAFTAEKRQPDTSRIGNTPTKSVVDIRNFFPETWLFDMESVGEDGESVTKAELPHTVTEWVANAVCINEQDGLGLSDTVRIKGFQAFFIGFTLPYSAIRGEKVPLIISIFNYLDKCLPITRTINVMLISDAGEIISEDSVSQEVCVCGGKTDTYKHMFTADKVGTANLTVLAESAQDSSVCGDQETANVVARDMATKPLKVEPEGFPQENVESFLFCPEDYDSSTYNGKLELNVPENAVEGSPRAFISASGDIMGPAIDGIDRLVRLPTGCGEQNMVLFTPNIVVLDYLTSVGKLTEAVKSKAIKNLQTGYQRELKYRHSDGSFSAFGVSDKVGSMWLSAFVLKSFSQATKYIDIDGGDLNQTISWIVNKQQADGCFPEVGKVLSQAMKGGVGSQGKNATSPLTAYVLSALLTSGYQNESLVVKALTCIEKDLELTPYTAALYGYTTVLAGSAEADRYLEWLSEKKQTKGDEMYWENINGSKSLNVETAAYAIMTILKRKGDAGLSQTLSIIRHLTRMRNSNGGFVSTQDTVVGLEAISSFASIISQDPVELTVTMADRNVEQRVTITEDDKILVKKIPVFAVPTTIQVTATGRGCGLIQATVRYNTPEPPKKQFFSLTIEAERTEDCKRATINVCTSYKPENQKSNMAIVEIKMVSGFAVITETLEKLKNDARVQLKRFDIENNNAVLYFDELSNDNVCFRIAVEEINEVEDSKPATAKVYDYYAKEKEELVEYQIKGTC